MDDAVIRSFKNYGGEWNVYGDFTVELSPAAQGREFPIAYYIDCDTMYFSGQIQSPNARPDRLIVIHAYDVTDDLFLRPEEVKWVCGRIGGKEQLLWVNDAYRPT